MSAQNSTPESNDEDLKGSGEGEETNGPEGVAGEENSTDDASADSRSTEDELPDWARKELTRTRKEAADRRVALREAEAKLKDAKTPEEFASATAELTEKIETLEYDLAKAVVVREHKIPAEYEEFLDVPREQLADKAKKLAALISASSKGDDVDDLDELSGGLVPRRGGSLPSDVSELIATIPRG